MKEGINLVGGESIVAFILGANNVFICTLLLVLDPLTNFPNYVGEFAKKHYPFTFTV